MTNQSKYLYRTNYFRREWTWVRRIFIMIFLGTAVLFIPLGDDLQFIKIIGILLVVVYYIAKPKDDLIVTEDLFVHIQRSVFKKFTRVDQYKISEIESMRCGGIHSDGWELVDFFNGGGDTGGYSNTVEITFKNDESKSLELAIDRKKLDTIVKIIYDLKKKSVAQQS